MSSLRDSMLMGVLGLLKAVGGRIDGRVRLQKEAFLLGVLGLPCFRPDRFQYHYYGPYSTELSDALRNAVAFGLISEERREFSENQWRYEYELTSEGYDCVGSDDSDASFSDKEVIKILQNNHWRTLELAATAAYLLQRSKAKNKEEAFALAEKLKPECKERSAGARILLETIGV